MEVQSLIAAIEAIDDDVHSISIGALKHAAEISPYVNERTLGPDLEPYEVELEQQTDIENDENLLNTSSKTDTPAKEIEKIATNTTPNGSSLQNLDLQTVVDSVRLRESEMQRRSKVRQTIIELQEKYDEVITKQTEKKEEVLQAAHDEWLAKKQQNEEMIRLKSEEKAEQELSAASSRLDDLLNKTQRQLFSIFFQGIVQYQRRFRLHYERISKILKPSGDGQVDYSTKMKQLVQMFDQLIMRIKGSGCGLAELQVAEKLCLALESLEQSLLSDMLKEEKEQKEQEKQKIIKQQEQQQKQAQFEQEQKQQAELKQQEIIKKQETQQQQQQQQQQQEQLQKQQQQQQQTIDNNSSKTDLATVSNLPPSLVSEERYKFYTHITEFYQEKVERVKPLQADESMKKLRFAIQKAINIPVNAISAFSAQHLRDKFEKLFSLLMGQVVKNPEGQFSTNDHALGRDYCLLLMAKKFVSQGDTVISSNPQAAFPVASVIVSLWKAVPDFGKIFLAYTFKESPFLVPYFIPQTPGQSMEDYLKVLGYRIIDNKPESQDMFLKRQAGIARLYAAVMVTGSAAQLDIAPHPYGVQHGWRWMANFVALEPLQDICATILQEVLQNAGFELWRNYGKQFVKLLLYIQQQYFPKLSAVDEGGPKARLELLLNKYLKEGQIPQPQGLLPPGFW